MPVEPWLSDDGDFAKVEIEPKRALDEVSEPVRKTPSHPRYAAKKGYIAPAVVKARPSTASAPE